MKSLTPEAWCAECVFLLQSISFVLLPLQILFQGQAKHDTTFETSC